MLQSQLLRLLPTLQMICDELNDYGWEAELYHASREWQYRGARVYNGQNRMEEDLIYLVDEDHAESFPGDMYAFISTVSLSGSREHICCPRADPTALLDVLLELFCRYRDWDAQLNQLVYCDGSLTDLCILGQKILGNPICIHDDWFSVIATTEDVPSMMPLDPSPLSPIGAIPRFLVEEFKFDSDYTNTYDQQRVRLWVSSPTLNSARCLYVNLWEGEVYRGRLLCLEAKQRLRSVHYLVTECIAQQAMAILRRDQHSRAVPYRSTDALIQKLLEGEKADPADVSSLFDTLGWKRVDRFLCVLLQPQQPLSSVMQHVLHGDLFRKFPSSYILLQGSQQQCLVINLSLWGESEQDLHYLLSPLCLDYCLYAGISSPVYGSSELRYAYHQAKIALEQAFTLRSERWIISFCDCALEYITRNIRSELPLGHLIAPGLLKLMEHDRQKDSDYFTTLKTYLLMERDIPKTAQALIIHRTTLQYRLKRIQELTRANLDDPELRLYWLLSLYLLDKGSHPARRPG